jgi:exodeoxyribonuclease VII large subunit
MSGTIELDRDGQHLLVRFPYDKYLVEEIKSLPGRRWDPQRKAWTFPTSNLETIVVALMARGFVMDSDVSSLLAGTSGVERSSAPAESATTAGDDKRTRAKSARAKAPTEAATAVEDPLAAWSIEALNTRVREAIANAFPARVKVIGEVTNFDKNRERKHLFFSLVEKEGDGGKIKATVDVALFERTAQRLLPQLERAGLTLRDGIEILIEAKIDLYPATGRYQLIVEDIRPEFTLGQLAQSREQILLALRQAGVERRNLELPVPVPSLRIGVLSSPDSDGWNDFVQELRRSGFSFDVTLVPVRVQGEELRPTMLRGLSWFARKAERFDLLCIVRGGGSRTDLAWFDDKDVAFAVARHPLKVLIGIGHERDRSVLDEIAESLKTPTAVATWLAEQARSVLEDLGIFARGLRDGSLQLLHDERIRLGAEAHRLQRSVQVRLLGERHELRSAVHRLSRTPLASLREERRRLDDRRQRMRIGIAGLVRDARARLSRAAELLGSRSAYRLERAFSHLAAQSARRRLLDPRAILTRGYAMLRSDDDGRIITDAARVVAGRTITVLLRDGEVRARAESTQIYPPTATPKSHGKRQEES